MIILFLLINGIGIVIIRIFTIKYISLMPSGLLFQGLGSRTVIISLYS